ncbi:HEAT repeat domain-containing protein [Paenibacillus sp. 1011MAR3C5]|uniref:HEAT repeat domain-containing protein n=1 Tax=Paenibacillus sp. 1011MAR3C5 TaxID=1675787 RepID=UPI000E6C3820|nr:HEAT repeat domain-containing protein [Paenibacillus sp. 1011MAR3C5]RJE91290.1 HEAT repeat domain-containing protein [Paenibacillus sp. 1011MAR3C5]
MDISYLLKSELKQFWDWLGLSSQEYELLGTITNSHESMYPRWDELIRLTCIAITNLEMGETSQIDLILEVMALDNEEEAILIECEEQLTNSGLNLLIEKGCSFPFRNARWQIAELIGRKKSREFENYLIALTNDDSKYVQRRALLSLVKINSQLANEISFQKLEDDNEMIRLVSIRILSQTSSDFLKEATKKLASDSSLLIKEELNKIMCNEE